MWAHIKLRRLAATALLVAWIAYTAFAQSTSPKRVLLVYEDAGTIPANIAFELSLAQSLRSIVGPTLEFYREQLDSSRFPEHTQSKIIELRSQYAERKIDVVLFFGTTPTEILPGVPVIQISNLSS